MSVIQLSKFACWHEWHKVADNQPTLVFLNGIMGSTSSWNDQLPVAEALNFNVLRFDFRCQGRSEVTEHTPTFLTHANDLIELMDTLGLSNVHLIGSSYGAEIGLLACALYPERFASQTAIAASAHVDRVLRAQIEKWAHLYKHHCASELVESLVTDTYSEAYFEKNYELVQARCQSTIRFIEANPQVFEGQIKLHNAYLDEKNPNFLLDQLKHTQCPTLVISAELDHVKPPRYSEAIAKAIPHSIYTCVKDAGHLVSHEQPHLINSLITGFILQVCTNKNPGQHSLKAMDGQLLSTNGA